MPTTATAPTAEAITALVERVSATYAAYETAAPGSDEDLAAEEAHDAAVAAAESAVSSALDEVAVTVECEEPDINECGGMTFADHDATIRVGAAECEARCWSYVGWLARGASADLDGSGLALWGDSQPGGWSVCDSDGQCSGRVRAESDRNGVHIYAAEGGRDTYLEAATILGMPSAAAVIADHLDIDDALARLARRISDAADSARPSVPEPDADDIWEELGAGAEVECTDGRVRAGRPWGESLVLIVVEDEDGDRVAYTECESWERPVRAASELVDGEPAGYPVGAIRAMIDEADED